METRILLDTNVWINMFLQVSPSPYTKLLTLLLNTHTGFQVLIDFYGATELVHSIRNLATAIHASVDIYERAFWSLIATIDCLLDFEILLGKELLKFARKKPEYLMLAEIFDLEPKDVPFIVLACKHKTSLITTDKKSLLNKRNPIQTKLKIVILSIEELYAQYRYIVCSFLCFIQERMVVKLRVIDEETFDSLLAAYINIVSLLVSDYQIVLALKNY